MGCWVGLFCPWPLIAITVITNIMKLEQSCGKYYKQDFDRN
jgi:hypothetical protein